MTESALDLGYARVDLGRESRRGLSEVVHGPGETAARIGGTVKALPAGNRGPAAVTRLEQGIAEQAPEDGYDHEARLLTWRPGFGAAMAAHRIARADEAGR